MSRIDEEPDERIPLLHELATDLYGRLVAMSDADLQQLRRECETLTSTNCWFACYELAPVVSSFAKIICRGRKFQEDKKG